MACNHYTAGRCHVDASVSGGQIMEMVIEETTITEVKPGWVEVTCDCGCGERFLKYKSQLCRYNFKDIHHRGIWQRGKDRQGRPSKHSQYEFIITPETIELKVQHNEVQPYKIERRQGEDVVKACRKMEKEQLPKERVLPPLGGGKIRLKNLEVGASAAGYYGNFTLLRRGVPYSIIYSHWKQCITILRHDAIASEVGTDLWNQNRRMEAEHVMEPVDQRHIAELVQSARYIDMKELLEEELGGALRTEVDRAISEVVEEERRIY